MSKPAVLALLLAVLSSVPVVGAPAAAPAPYLVKDLNRAVSENAGSVPIPLGIAGGRAVFSTRKGQLWASDGTTGGTFLLKDLAPLPLRARKAQDDHVVSQALTEAAGRLFFIAKADGFPRELWATDGTPQGTRQLVTTSVTLYDPQSSPEAYFWSEPLQTFFFWAFDKAHGTEPWVSDGTPQGTHLLRDTVPGVAFSGAGAFGSAGSTVIFFADPGLFTDKVWRSDGTEAGTAPIPGTGFLAYDFLSLGRQAAFIVFGQNTLEVWVTDGASQGTKRLTTIPGAGEDWDLRFLGATTGRLYFYTIEGDAGYGLWTSDGTAAGTRALVRFPSTRALYTNPQGLRFLPNGTALFYANDGVHGMEWWRSDGTEAGTRLLKDVCPGDCAAVSFLGSRPVPVGDKLFTHLEGEPWISDGTEAGTRQIEDTCPGPCGASSFSRFSLGGLGLYSARQDGEENLDLWRTDGTAAGTFRLLQSQRSKGFLYLPGIVIGDRLLFDNDDGRLGMELWTTDGTIAGTHLVADLDGAAPAGSAPSQITPLGKSVFFVADDGVRGPSLWKSNGTAKGTLRVYSPASPPAVPYAASFSHLMASNGRLIFSLAEAGAHPRLWASDGTAQGTRPISGTILAESWSWYLPLGNRLLFPGYDGLWVTDGTPGGTLRVTSRVVPEHDAYARFRRFAALGDKLLFSAASEGGLWRTDGTDAGTVLIQPLYIQDADWAVLGGKVYFRASGPEGTGLYASDGTAAGTRFVGAPLPGPFTAAGGRFFSAEYLKASRAALWVTDGTATGTRKLTEVGLSTAYMPAQFLKAAGNKVFFVAKDASHGLELWRSDGTVAGTFMLQDINPGAAGSVPDGLVAAGGILYFSAYDGQHGTELWRSDGTRAGTLRLTEIVPGTRSANPQELTLAGPRLFFSADDGSHGAEPWALCLASPCSSSAP